MKRMGMVIGLKPERAPCGVRGPESAPVYGEHELFGFLTTAANATVASIHPRPRRSFR